ncbi:hypothetical protein FRC16_001795 [Serendipita sp. 398]|nr:hypothetical protein FRC16_001795 [Serendipita sp. 398]
MGGTECKIVHNGGMDEEGTTVGAYQLRFFHYLLLIMHFGHSPIPLYISTHPLDPTLAPSFDDDLRWTVLDTLLARVRLAPLSCIIRSLSLLCVLLMETELRM